MSESTLRAARAALAIAVALLAGCAGTTAGDWVERTPWYSTAEGPAQAAFAAAARTPVYSTPDASSPVQGVLALHEKVARYQSEAGFVYVETETLSGWVREQQLAASLPRARKPAAAAKPAAAKPAPAPPAEPPPAEEPPAEETAEESPAPEPEPVEPERSVFDPY